MRSRPLQFLALLAFVTLGIAQAKENPCPAPIDSVTEPLPVNIEDVLSTVRSLRTVGGKPALQLGPETDAEVRKVFDVTKVKTKMEQFFRLLNVIQSRLNRTLPSVIDLEATGAQKTLITSAVFTDPAIPSEIEGVRMDRTNDVDPRYTVRFKKKQTHVPLNKGQGFWAFDEGMCQHTKALIFSDEFSFSLRQLGNGNLVARYFRGVDVFGAFGSRGIFDVDLQYVSLGSVEFFTGSKMGRIQAKVSPEEFRKNDHNPVLRIITKFVGDSSVQPIDW